MIWWCQTHDVGQRSSPSGDYCHAANIDLHSQAPPAPPCVGDMVVDELRALANDLRDQLAARLGRCLFPTQYVDEMDCGRVKVKFCGDCTLCRAERLLGPWS